VLVPGPNGRRGNGRAQRSRGLNHFKATSRELPERRTGRHQHRRHWPAVDQEGFVVDALVAFLHTIVSGAVFTNEFGVLPELDFAETPVGTIYIATRRVGDNIWARMVENVLPNLQQVAPIWETGQTPHPFSGPMMSRWVVPLDDTNTMLVELRHVSETAGMVTPGWWADRSIMLPGQIAAETYEESQRRPQDFEAQVSQRPIAVHGLEHLGTTDRGISMFRNQIRAGIRAVTAGNDPVGLFRDGGGMIPTYCNDTVVPEPAAKTPELDRKLLRETGRRLAEGYIAAPPLLAAAD
jgi:hypothetical protein